MKSSETLWGIARIVLWTLIIAAPFALGIGLGQLPVFATPATGIETPIREFLVLLGVVGSLALMIYFFCGGYQLSSSSLIVRSQFFRTRIPFRAIQAITDMQSHSRKARRKVAITYLKTGKPTTISIRPRDIDIFVQDLLKKCPHLTGFDETRLKKDRTFSEAIGQS
ncbi:MAG: PH domain-containing protein [Verrucomicrobiota bacterium]